MAKTTRPLTARFLNSVTTPGKYYDQHGLFIQVYPTGAKCWQQRLTIRGRRRTLGLGGYPTITLKMARAAALENKRAVHSGHDLLLLKQRPAVPTFAQAAAIVVEGRRRNWTAARTAASWTRSFERLVFPQIGDRSVADIRSSDVLDILTPIWTVTRDQARKLRWRIRLVMDWAVAHGHIPENPAGDAIRGALPSNYTKRTHYAAVPHDQVAGVIVSVHSSGASIVVKLLFEFLVLTAVRGGEARGARWNEVDFESAMWTVPAERMKGREEHRVPLSSGALEVLHQAWALSLDPRGVVFASRSGGIFRSDPLGKMLRRLGVPGVPHGFRSSFRDWCGENGVARELAEACLAHKVGNQTEAAYARSDLLERRRKVMQDWAVYLSGVGSASSSPAPH